jgi:hypothetical protein
VLGLGLGRQDLVLEVVVVVVMVVVVVAGVIRSS